MGTGTDAFVGVFRLEAGAGEDAALVVLLLKSALVDAEAGVLLIEGLASELAVPFDELSIPIALEGDG